MPGSPAMPLQPTYRMAMYLGIGIVLALIGGLQNGFLLANLVALQGDLGMTSVETGWLTAAFSVTNSCGVILLFKVRQQFGIERFVIITVTAFLFANAAQLFNASIETELVTRAVSGIAASGLTALAIFYVMQGMPSAKKMFSSVMAIGVSQISLPLARAISPVLLSNGSLYNLLELQFALAVLAFGLLLALPLPETERIKSFSPLDLVTLALLAVGLGFLCGFFIQGPIQWWDRPWLGYALAMAIVCIGLAFSIEHYRSNPMLFTRWMRKREILSFAVAGVVVRFVLSEQNYGASGLFANLGMTAEQLVPYQSLLTGAAALGMLVSFATISIKDLTRPVLIAIGIIAVASFADMHSSIATRPQNLYCSQAAIAFASVYFMGPMMLQGMLRALGSGPSYIISFMAVFSLSQNVGGLAGTALMSTFYSHRLKEHLMSIGQSLSFTDPSVAQAAAGLAQTYRGTISDPALLQAEGVGRLVILANQQAAVMAFNDVCFLTGSVASIAFVIIAIRWAYNRFKGINPLQPQLAAMQARKAGANKS